MKAIELIFVTTTFVTFPVTLYIIFISFRKRFKKGEKQMYFDLVMYITTLILICYVINNSNNFIEILSIPILITLMHNKPKISFNICLVNILYLYFETNTSLLILIPQHLSYFVLYFIIHKRKSKTNLIFLNSFILFTILFKLLLLLMNNTTLYPTLFSTVIYTTVCYISYFLITKINSLFTIYNTLNEIKTDNSIRLNISKISHEVKNPLVVIKGYLEVLDNESIINSKNNLLNEVNYALDILNDFKDLNHMKLKKENFYIIDIIQELKEDIIPFYSDKNIICNYECNKNIQIKADKKRIKQVLINLVKNSVESLQNNGIIDIKVYKKNRNIIIKIKDNGKGMDKKTLDSLFIPFYTKKESGTGLGLCLSKEIIEKHNGTIKYISEINKYTEVKISLPTNSKDNKN